MYHYIHPTSSWPCHYLYPSDFNGEHLKVSDPASPSPMTGETDTCGEYDTPKYQAPTIEGPQMTLPLLQIQPTVPQLLSSYHHDFGFESPLSATSSTSSAPSWSSPAPTPTSSIPRSPLNQLQLHHHQRTLVDPLCPSSPHTSAAVATASAFFRREEIGHRDHDQMDAHASDLTYDSNHPPPDSEHYYSYYTHQPVFDDDYPSQHASCSSCSHFTSELSDQNNQFMDHQPPTSCIHSVFPSLTQTDASTSAPADIWLYDTCLPISSDPDSPFRHPTLTPSSYQQPLPIHQPKPQHPPAPILFADLSCHDENRPLSPFPILPYTSGSREQQPMISFADFSDPMW